MGPLPPAVRPVVRPGVGEALAVPVSLVSTVSLQEMCAG